MTFLPIVGRELRVAARKRSTFWLRVTAALIGLLIGSGCMILMALAGVPRLGSALFGTLTWLSIIAALSAGLFFTSDSLSEEKREGTLGFLFLTDLRGYDVVAGKLLATSLRGAYGLLALFPVLAITLLLGGVTGVQLWKTTLALLNALLCSLTAGLFVSAMSRDSQKALAATLLLLLVMTFGGLLGDWAIAAASGRSFVPLLSLSSPAYVFVNAGAWGRSAYWNGLLTTQIACWVLFLFACVVAPRSWQERSRRAAGTGAWAYAWKYGGHWRRTRLRRRWLDRNPMLWLACRERWQSVGIWIIAILVTGGFATASLSRMPREAWMIWIYAGALYTFLLYLWAASQSCRFFVEARRSGLLELLLSAPVSERQMVRGHWRGLVRMFGLPLVLITGVHVAATTLSRVTMGRMMISGGGTGGAVDWVMPLCSAALSIATTVGNLIALAWCGMWMGLTSKNANWATVKTFLFVQILPQILFYFLSAAGSLLLLLPFLSRNLGGASGSGSPGSFMSWYSLVVPAINDLLTIAKDVGFFLLARKKLYESFRLYASGTSGSRAVSPPPLPGPLASPPVPAAQT
jgi:hypothetical protein